MQRHVCLALLVCALSADAAVADEPSPSSSSAAPPKAPSSRLVDKADALVRAQLVQPMAAREKKRSVFSRAPPQASERRVRILDAAPAKDGADRGYVRFAIDERWFDDEWSNDDLTGCVYVDDDQVFVDVGDAFRRADAFFAGRAGSKDDVPVVCRAPTPKG
jgi:hypothetical protein